MTADIKTMIMTIGGGAAGWQTKAAEVLGVSRGTIRNALSQNVSDKTFRTIRATYAAMVRHAVPQDADKTAGHWIIGMPLKRTTDKSILEECVVTHMPEPTFSAHVILRAGKTAPGPKGDRAVEVRITTVSGETTGVGQLIEKAREIGLDYLKKSQYDRLEMMYRDDVEARAVAAKWGSAKEARGAKIAELVDAFDVLTDDDVQAAHDMIRTMQAEAMEPKRQLGTLTAREPHAPRTLIAPREISCFASSSGSLRRAVSSGISMMSDPTNASAFDLASFMSLASTSGETWPRTSRPREAMRIWARSPSVTCLSSGMPF